jgi:HSP20 family protein
MSDRDDPFSEIEQLFDQFAELGGATASGTSAPVDIADTGDTFVVTVDLPGFESDDIDVQLDDERTLRVSGQRETDDHIEDSTVVKRERHSRQVSRTLTLPDAVDMDQTEASYENGVLTVRLGKETAGDEGTDIPVN